MSDPYDAIGPPRGPCAFCDSPDARHRVVDSIVEAVDAGDDPAAVGDDFGLDADQVLALVQHEHERGRKCSIAPSELEDVIALVLADDENFGGLEDGAPGPFNERVATEVAQAVRAFFLLPAPKYERAAVEFPEWRNLAQLHADALGPAGALARAVLTLTDPDIYFVRPVFIEVGEDT